MNPNLNSIAERLRYLVKDVFLMDAENFAREVGLSGHAIRHMVNGTSNPGMDAMRKICEKYPEVNPNWLLSGEGEPLISGPNEASSFISAVNDEEKREKILLAIKNRLSELKMKQKDLAKKMGYTTPTISVNLNGKRSPKIPFWKKLVDAIDTSEVELMESAGITPSPEFVAVKNEQSPPKPVKQTKLFSHTPKVAQCAPDREAVSKLYDLKLLYEQKSSIVESLMNVIENLRTENSKLRSLL